MESLYLKQLYYELPVAGALQQPARKEALWKLLTKHLKQLDAPGRKVLLLEGETALRIYLLVSGCARAYFYNPLKNRIHTLTLWKGPAIVAAARSFFYQLPAAVSLEISSKYSEVYYLDYPSVELIRQTFPETEYWIEDLLMTHLMHYITRLRNLMTLPLATYYQLEQKEHPGFLDAFSKDIQASYFMVEPATYSRMLGSLEKKKEK